MSPALDGGEDGVGGFGPDEGCRVFVAVCDVGVYGADEFRDARDGEASELTLGQFGEEALDEIEPGRAGGNEVEVDPGMFFEPPTHLLVLVRGIVVEDEMNVEIWSGSHPFYTGKSSFVDTAGRVEKFQKKFQGNYFKKKDAKKK